MLPALSIFACAARSARLPCIVSLPWLALFALAVLNARAADPVPDATAKSLAASAAAILEKHCVECHGGRLTRSGFNLTTRDGLLKGGDSGPVIAPGDAKASRLYELVSHTVEPGMPFKRKKLADDEIAILKAWIDGGAAYTG